MARYKGHEGAGKVGSDSIGEVEGFDLEHSVMELDANVQGSSWTDVEAGQASMSGTINVLRDPADAGQAALVVGTSVTLSLYPEGETTSLTEITGDFLVTGRSYSSTVGDLVKDSLTIRNKGAITIGSVT